MKRIVADPGKCLACRSASSPCAWPTPRTDDLVRPCWRAHGRGCTSRRPGNSPCPCSAGIAKTRPASGLPHRGDSARGRRPSRAGRPGQVHRLRVLRTGLPLRRDRHRGGRSRQGDASSATCARNGRPRGSIRPALRPAPWGRWRSRKSKKTPRGGGGKPPCGWQAESRNGCVRNSISNASDATGARRGANPVRRSSTATAATRAC